MQTLPTLMTSLDIDIGGEFVRENENKGWSRRSNPFPTATPVRVEVIVFGDRREIVRRRQCGEISIRPHTRGDYEQTERPIDSASSIADQRWSQPRDSDAVRHFSPASRWHLGICALATHALRERPTRPG